VRLLKAMPSSSRYSKLAKAYLRSSIGGIEQHCCAAGYGTGVAK
jgi:hypothetical protein